MTAAKLITCPDCAGVVSVHAKTCPQCGRQMRAGLLGRPGTRQRTQNLGCLTIMVAAVVLPWLFGHC